MKTSAFILRNAVCLTMLSLLCAAAIADDNGPTQTRITVLMLSMPEEKYLAYLPGLLDKDKIEKAVPQLLDAVKRKDITLEGCSIIVTKSGQRAVNETVIEYSDDRSILSAVTTWYTGQGYAPVTPSTPDVFETRNIGVTLEVEPVIDKDGRHIDLNICPQHVEFLGYQTFVLPKLKDVTSGEDADPRQPIFACVKASTSVNLPSGRHILLAVHKKPGGTMEIFILGAEVIGAGD